MLPVVRTIEAQMSSDPTLNKEYLPLSGMLALTEGLTGSFWERAAWPLLRTG